MVQILNMKPTGSKTTVGGGLKGNLDRELWRLEKF